MLSAIVGGMDKLKEHRKWLVAERDASRKARDGNNDAADAAIRCHNQTSYWAAIARRDTCATRAAAMQDALAGALQPFITRGADDASTAGTEGLVGSSERTV